MKLINLKNRLSGKMGFWLLMMMNFLIGFYLLRIYLIGKSKFFVHPDYEFLVLLGGGGVLLFVLLAIIFGDWRRFEIKKILGGNVWALILIGLMLFTEPRALSSFSAESRSVDLNLDSVLSRKVSVVSSFNVNTENRSMIDWIRLQAQDNNLLNFVGQKVKLTGFVFRDVELGEDLVYLSRFVIACCAADARPIGLPMLVSGFSEKFDNDQWLEVRGEFDLMEIEGEEVLVIKPNEVLKIEVPDDPYAI